ncbi:MAG: DUF2750 domain-containing protein [Oleiphilaceae bacterium]|uniref:DUF2750 domain-containing protein n=1 Tax=Oleiphilus sp. HI0125 TaxID=1822266 RepID=UPI0007C2358B|nr:DUF2750 domain-containing protein [Oleiphilus sp. HI0125]KZZ58992.1 hypothetical protein A3762_17480 [Oleiphilus sp. HI0125]KZZ59930.1 hypothetical protein A3762_04010 [Oleiphilus sp. HI0125]MCH2157581.1 DUF2750 domain-containing protein [Oleiphilaceae bacterium]
MTKQSLEQLSAMEPEDRYDYTIEQILEHKQLWVLINAQQDFITINYEEDAFSYLPMWPSKEAAVAISEFDQEVTAIAIPVDTFIDDLAEELDQAKIEIGVFPGADTSVWVCDATDFKHEIKDALKSL